MSGERKIKLREKNKLIFFRLQKLQWQKKRFGLDYGLKEIKCSKSNISFYTNGVTKMGDFTGKYMYYIDCMVPMWGKFIKIAGKWS